MFWNLDKKTLNHGTTYKNLGIRKKTYGCFEGTKLPNLIRPHFQTRAQLISHSFVSTNNKRATLTGLKHRRDKLIECLSWFT